MRHSVARWQVASTLGVVVLSVTATVLGLFLPGQYQDGPALVAQYQAQDVTVLIVGVPVVTVGLWAATHGSHRGRLVWLGGLAYMTYIWATVGLQTSFNRFFLGYVALFGLSLFTLVGGVVSSDPASLARTFEGRLSERLYGGFLALIGLGLALLWLAELVPATLTGQPPALVSEVGPQATVSHFLDLGVVVPVLLLAGSWLRQRRPWGYVLAGVALVFGAVLAPTLVATTAVVLVGKVVTVSPLAVVFTVLPAVAAAGLAVSYLRAVPGVRAAASTGVG